MIPTVSSCLKKAVHFLKSAGVPEAEISAEELLSHVLTRPRLSLYLEPDGEVDRAHESEFETLLAKRAGRYPLQYLLGTASFRNTVLGVGEGCLIPRPETEGLVGLVLNRLATKSGSLKLLDVGAGSGNIAISLTQERPEWFVTASDISHEALRYAKINADRNQVADRIRLIQTDLWNGIEGSFDALVSNPPYLTELELSSLQPEIEFEPRVALDGGEDGLSFFKRIICDAKGALKKEGFIFFEVGVGKAPAVSEILAANGFTAIQISKDDADIDRFVSAIRV